MPQPPLVFVVGDAVLDLAVDATHYRRTPEDSVAPVLPAVTPTVTNSVPGGAANVAANLAAQGCRVRLFAPTAPDPAGEVLWELCYKSGIGYSRHNFQTAPRTTVKTRYYEGDRLIARVDADYQAATPVQPPSDLGESPAAVVLTDYGKGAITAKSAVAWADWAHSRGVLILADPKHGRQRLWDYVPLTCMVANWEEASHCREPFAAAWPDRTDDQHAGALASRLADRGWGPFGAVVVKRGCKGSVFATRRDLDDNQGSTELDIVYIPPIAPKAVYSVVGAGDTYIAGMTAGLVRGLSFPDACLLGSAAAGVAVGIRGTAVVSSTEATATLRPYTDVAAGFLTPDGAAAWAIKMKGFGFQLVVVEDSFDPFTAASAALLTWCRDSYPDAALAVLINDAGAHWLNGDRPTRSLKDRTAVVAAVNGVDAVTWYSDKTPDQTLEKFRPDVFVCRGKGPIVGQQWGMKVVKTPDF